MNESKSLVVSMIIILTFVVLMETTMVSPEGEQAYIESNMHNEQKVAVILIDYAFLKDLEQCPSIRKICDEGSISLVSNRLTGTPSLHKSRLIYSTGKLLDIDASMLDAGGSADALKKYFINTGTSVKAGTLTYLDLISLKNINHDSYKSQHIGIIGDTIRKNNKKTCVVGNSDASRRNRSAVFIAMDSNGIVDYGDMDNVLVNDESFPGGKRTDYSKLVELYKQFLPACSFVVLDTGDLSRLEQHKKSVSINQYEKYKELTLKRIDKLVFDITDHSPDTTLIIVSMFTPRLNDKGGIGLSPIIVHDGGEGGLLYSKSTKMAGIITNTDFSDLILDKLGLQSKGQVRTVSKPDPYDYVYNREQLHNRISAIRPPVLKAYTILVIFSLLLVLLLFLNNRYKFFSRFKKTVKLILLSDIVMPFVFLYLPAEVAPDPTVYMTVTILIAIVLSSFITFVCRHDEERFALACFAVAAGIITDVLLGSAYMKQSVLGYDPIIGARFYGIGNEYTGVLIGAAFVFIGSILEKYRCSKKIGRLNTYLLWLMAIATIITGMPFWGANFGGALAMLTGWFFLFILTKGKKPGFRLVFALAVVIIVFTFIITTIDLINKDNYTHIGRLALEIKEEGFNPFYNAMIRKAEMNIKLIRYTIWTKVLLCIIFAVSVLFFKPVGLLKRVFSRYSYHKKSWICMSAASIAGFIANDSGIVLAGIAMIYLGCTLLYICIGQVDALS